MTTRADRPHIVLVLADDLGYNGVGYHNNQLLTPNLDQLAANGLRISSFYAYRLCGPSRASLLTGRMPYKLEATRTNFIEFWEESGTELSYTMLPEQLRRQGYSTHLVGKWHQGFYHPSYLPLQRGFESFFGFLGGCEDHVTQRVCPTACERRDYPGVGQPVDLFRNRRVALGENGSTSGYSHNCLRFAAAATKVVQDYALRVSTAPLFLFLSLQDPHAPIQTPPRFERLYTHSSPLRNRWSGMVSAIDETVANVTSALRRARMWQQTLFVFASDNGSPVAGWGAAGSNAPFRGGKGNDWEGGVRTPAFVSGGWVPRDRRGLVLTGLMHICDFYATFCSLAGAVSSDGRRGCPRDRGPAPMDSVDMSSWWLSGQPEAPSPRQEIVHDLNAYSRGGADGVRRRSGVIRVGAWKLLAKRSGQAAYFGAFSPEPPANISAARIDAEAALSALVLRQRTTSDRLGFVDFRARRRALQGKIAALKQEGQARLRALDTAAACSLLRPCLFNIARDPIERHDVSSQHPQHVRRLRALLARRWDEFHLGERPFGRNGEKPLQTVARWRRGYCAAALGNRGFMAPWYASADAPRAETPAYGTLVNASGGL
jgi:arylsulfatase B